MKIKIYILGIFLATALNGCVECNPNLDDWKTHKARMKTIVHLYEDKKLEFGRNNPRAERVIPDSLRIDGYDSVIITNIGSRNDISNKTHTCRFYKLNQLNKRIQEVVFTTQIHELSELKKSSCSVKVAPNWYIRKIN